MEFYIYDLSTGDHVDTITGADNADCERLAAEQYDWNDYCGSYVYAPRIEVQL